jgi:hypothetical protein
VGKRVELVREGFRWVARIPVRRRRQAHAAPLSRRVGCSISYDARSSAHQDRWLDRLKDALAIGLILCRDRSPVLAEYALHGVSKPIGVSECRLTPNVRPN